MSENTAEERACRAMCVCRASGQLGTAYHTDNCCFIQWPAVHGEVAKEIRAAVAEQKEKDAEENARLREALVDVYDAGDAGHADEVVAEIVSAALHTDEPTK